MSALSVEAIRALGSDLLVELSHAAGDEDALEAIFQHWLEVVGTPDVLFVTAAALQEAFASCVVMVLDTEGDTAA
ncbi:hypothetical protein [Nocardioides caldifontis]|uniref:hypothetical protein n=1 Tax=Nocardioides caldifontis TaxID=2588938 RepID=UPI0011DFE76A|nr:hypothetical protein [Nocardioides caldifontis]